MRIIKRMIGAVLLAGLLLSCLGGGVYASADAASLQSGDAARAILPAGAEQEIFAAEPTASGAELSASGDAEQHTSGGVLTHIVVKGDTLWKLAVKHEVGLSEIIAANPQIKDPHWIYPGDTVYIPVADASVSEMEAEVIRLVNEIRRENGLGELKANWQLSRVARYKSQDMHDKGYFSHTSPTYGTPFRMMTDFGISYRTAGENIAMGYRTAKAVVDGWMNSPGHRANILNASFTEIGVGFVKDGFYWTQMFIG